MCSVYACVCHCVGTCRCIYVMSLICVCVHVKSVCIYKNNLYIIIIIVVCFIQTPPPNSDTLQQARYSLLPDFHFAIPEWYPTDVRKLKAGVRQKNIELLALPMKNE